MYFVDRRKIEMTLNYMDKCLLLFKLQQEWAEPLDKLALERIAQVLIESILDVGNQLIDGFIMRDPGSYDDIIDILTDEQVIPQESEKKLKELIGFRKQLVQSYIDIDHNYLHELVKRHYHPILNFPIQVREYIHKELGPVSAFLPEDK